MFDVAGFPAILSGIDHHFKQSVDTLIITTQELFFENHLKPGCFLNLQVFCRLLKLYNGLLFVTVALKTV